MKNRTIEFYDNYAKEFCESTVNAEVAGLYDKFLKYIPSGGRILDLGCGSGRDSKNFIEGGYLVEALDGSQAMCVEAEKYIGRRVRCCKFQEVDYVEEFDGIWACSSLLHVKKEALGDILKKLERALYKKGVLYASFKYGQEEWVDTGRHYSDFTLEGIDEFAKKYTELEVVELYLSEDVLRGERKRWTNIILRKI